jgi:hypothetical protein
MKGERIINALSVASRCHKKVIIVGGANMDVEVPFGDDRYEVWTLNDCFESVPRCSRLFQLHGRDTIDTYITRHSQQLYLPLLQSIKCPVYMTRKYDDIPSSVAYPLVEVVESVGPYFTSTMSYMIALAVFEGYEEIFVVGVDPIPDSEYEEQRAACEYHLGVAVGRGIGVVFPSSSHLLRVDALYGFLTAVVRDNPVTTIPLLKAQREANQEYGEETRAYHG